MTAQKSIPITISSLTKTYGSVYALNDVGLEIRSGEFITLLGPSGSGKTTLLMALAGFIRPDTGSLKFGDREMVLEPPHKRNVGMMFQNYALFPHMTVGENIGYPLKIRKIAKAEITERVNGVLDLVQLGGYGRRAINQLSGGQRQRVALARAIVFEPRVLLMDEPLSALDKNLRESMQIEIRRLHNELKMTTVCVTHDQREALTMSDRVAVLNDGKIIQTDEPRALYEKPCDLFVANFVGESTTIPVEIRDGEAYLGSVRLNCAGPERSIGGPCNLIVRPEKIYVLRSDDGADGLNRIPGTLEDVIFQGETMHVTVSLPSGKQVVVRRPSRADDISSLPEVGQPVVLGLRFEDTILLGSA